MPNGSVIESGEPTRLGIGFYHLRTLNSKQATGRAGFTKRDYQSMGPLAHRIHQMDVTREMGKNHNWEDYISRPSLAAAISPYIYFAARTRRSRTSSLSTQ